MNIASCAGLPVIEKKGLLLIGDPHVADVPPGQRLPGYREQIIRKVRLCLEHAEREGLEPVFLGDLFNWPRDNSNALIVELIELFRPYKPWVLVGNHDKYQARYTDDVSMAVLDAAGAVRLMVEPKAQFLLRTPQGDALVVSVPDGHKLPKVVSIGAEGANADVGEGPNVGESDVEETDIGDGSDVEKADAVGAADGASVGKRALGATSDTAGLNTSRPDAMGHDETGHDATGLEESGSHSRNSDDPEAAGVAAQAQAVPNVPDTQTAAQTASETRTTRTVPGTPATQADPDTQTTSDACTPADVIMLTHHNIRFPEFLDRAYSIKELPGVTWVINGHIHRPQATVKKGMTTWANPGNITRLTFSRRSLERIPAAAIWTPGMDDLDKWVVPHQDFYEVFPEQDFPPEDAPTEDGESRFLQGLERLAWRRSREGAGLKQFLRDNLDPAEPETELIWKLYEEAVSHDE